jgi:hypothetical protein
MSTTSSDGPHCRRGAKHRAAQDRSLWSRVSATASRICWRVWRAPSRLMATTLAFVVLAVTEAKATAPRTPGLKEARPAVMDPSSNPVANRFDGEYARQGVVHDVQLIEQRAVFCATLQAATSQRRNSFSGAAGGRLVPATRGIHFLARTLWTDHPIRSHTSAMPPLADLIRRFHEAPGMRKHRKIAGATWRVLCPGLSGLASPPRPTASRRRRGPERFCGR